MPQTETHDLVGYNDVPLTAGLREAGWSPSSRVPMADPRKYEIAVVIEKGENE